MAKIAGGAEGPEVPGTVAPPKGAGNDVVNVLGGSAAGLAGVAVALEDPLADGLPVPRHPGPGVAGRAVGAAGDESPAG